MPSQNNSDEKGVRVQQDVRRRCMRRHSFARDGSSTYFDSRWFGVLGFHCLTIGMLQATSSTEEVADFFKCAYYPKPSFITIQDLDRANKEMAVTFKWCNQTFRRWSPHLEYTTAFASGGSKCDRREWSRAVTRRSTLHLLRCPCS